MKNEKYKFRMLGMKWSERGVSRLSSAGVKRTIPSALKNIGKSIVPFTPPSLLLSLPFTPNKIMIITKISFLFPSL